MTEQGGINMNFTRLKDFMDHLTEWRIPGNSIAVYYKHKEVFRYSSGYSDMHKKIRMQGDEYVNIYSCSKVATVVAALQLYERCLFLLDDPLYDFIPEYREMYIMDDEKNIKKAENPITLRNLFTMTSGITYNLESEGINAAKKDTAGKADTITAVKYMAKDPLAFEPGTHWRYGLSHDVLAAVVEIISGQKFSEYVNEHIFQPIGTKVFYHRSEELKRKMATQYEYRTSEESVDLTSVQEDDRNQKGYIVEIAKDIGNAELGSEYDSGGAGITTTVADYAKFADVLANGGRAANGERILSAGMVELLKTNQLNEKLNQDLNWSHLRGYGYGLGVRTMINRAMSGSNGSLGEFGWGGAAGATLMADTETGFSYFYAHHMRNPQEGYYQPRLRNIAYACMDCTPKK